MMGKQAGEEMEKEAKSAISQIGNLNIFSALENEIPAGRLNKFRRANWDFFHFSNCFLFWGLALARAHAHALPVSTFDFFNPLNFCDLNKSQNNIFSSENNVFLIFFCLSRSLGYSSLLAYIYLAACLTVEENYARFSPHSTLAT